MRGRKKRVEALHRQGMRGIVIIISILLMVAVMFYVFSHEHDAHTPPNRSTALPDH